jgi:hypothetical protein
MMLKASDIFNNVSHFFPQSHPDPCAAIDLLSSPLVEKFNFDSIQKRSLDVCCERMH